MADHRSAAGAKLQVTQASSKSVVVGDTIWAADDGDWLTIARIKVCEDTGDRTFYRVDRSEATIPFGRDVLALQGQVRELSVGAGDMDPLWLRAILTDYRKRAIPVAERESFDMRCESILARLRPPWREDEALAHAERMCDGLPCETCGCFIPAGEGGERYHAEDCPVGNRLLRDLA